MNTAGDMGKNLSCKLNFGMKNIFFSEINLNVLIYVYRYLNLDFEIRPDSPASRDANL